eukprot:m.265127 g.265127  ORF g.265127 m.265127 type:complete len:64 (+) comp59968_c0_seq1:64-255(+)
MTSRQTNATMTRRCSRSPPINPTLARATLKQQGVMRNFFKPAAAAQTNQFIYPKSEEEVVGFI